MNENNTEEFFTANHKRLYTIAKWMNIFSWILLVLYLISLVFNIFNSTIQYNSNNNNGYAPGFLKYLFQNIEALLWYLTTWFTIAAKGVVYFLVLKGFSMGLNMIIETDLNYRETTQEVQHAE